MSRLLGIVIVVVTLGLVGLGWLQSAGAAGVLHSDDTPERATNSLLDNIRSRNFDAAYDSLANAGKLDRDDFTRELAGTDGSLRTYSSLQDTDATMIHKVGDEATVRVKMNWATAIGTISDTRDLKVVRQGGDWRVVWPTPPSTKLPARVIPVNYLRWDVVNRGPEGDWGASGIDSPKVRIISMNAVERPEGIVIMGEAVNEDTIPAYVNVNATLVSPNGTDLGEESSFDKISHILLPSQVTPYRVDFPKFKLKQIKQVRMDIKAGPVAASADPVIGVMNQRLDTDALGKKVLRGDLEDQSGQVVNIAHVLATCYDNNGKVIWVSDGYIQRALLPMTPQPFTLSLPDDVASRAQNFRVVVTHYSNQGNS
jgi:hypothetical protein